MDNGKEGDKSVEIVPKDDKRQVTAVFSGTYTGDFLPPRIVYHGKTTRCLPQYDFLPLTLLKIIGRMSTQ